MSHPHTAFMLPDHSSQFDEQLIAGAPIITLSWNSPANHTRRFRLQAKKGIEGVIPQAPGWSSLNGAPVVQMRNGDLLIMGGLSQRTHRHELMAPHSRNADERLGRRVSLTFRAFDEASVVAAADAAASATKAAEAAAWLERSRPSATLQRLESEVGWFEEAYTGAMSREYRHYMRREWGFEKRGDQELFEMLCLEGAQAGLSWATILSRRTAYRKAFHAFDIERVAQMTKEEEQRLLEAPVARDGGATTIVRNRLKVASVPRNARAALKIIEEGRRWSAFSGEARPRHGYLDAFLWSFVNERPRLNRWTSAADIPSEDETSRVMSAALIDKGFNFVGPIICYALMQSCGMVVDHPLGIFITQTTRFSHMSHTPFPHTSELNAFFRHARVGGRTEATRRRRPPRRRRWRWWWWWQRWWCQRERWPRRPELSSECSRRIGFRGHPASTQRGIYARRTQC